MVKFNNLLKNFKSLNSFEIVLFIFLILYLVSNISTPYELSKYVNNSYTYLSLIFITVILFIYSNPLLAIVFSIVSIIFITRSKQTDLKVIKPSEKNKINKLKNLNSNLNDKTLEEEIIYNMLKKPINIAGPADYHPVTCDSHDADNL